MDERSAPEGTMRPGRLAGVDVARALALIGMFAVHFGPKGETDLLGRFYALPHGRASILFVLVAGVGVALLSARPERWADARLRLFCFSLFLLPLGLALETLRHPVAVILQHYAVFYLLGIAALGLSRRWLAVLATVFTLVGPLIYYAGMMMAPTLFDRESAELGDSLGTIFLTLLFTGPYSLIVWGGPLLWGLWIGRHNMRSPKLRLRLMIVGAGLAIASFLASEVLFGALGEPPNETDWRYIFADTPHSQMPLWVLGATGSAAFVLGGALEIAERLPRFVAPLADLGQIALTAYVAQILLLTAAAPLVHHTEVVPAIVSVTTFTTLAAIFAVYWRRHYGRGPVERAMHLTWEAADALWPGPATRPAASAPAPNREPRGSASP